MSRQQDFDKNVAQIRPKLTVAKPKQSHLAEEAEDTSHDAGELNSQITVEDPVAVGGMISRDKKPLQGGYVNFNTSTAISNDKDNDVNEILKKEIGHPDAIVNNNKSSEESSDDDEDESEEEPNNKEFHERDENFVIESDNVNDKLYSSETEDDDNDKKVLADQKSKKLLTKEKNKGLNLSSSCASSSSEESTETTKSKEKLNENSNVKKSLQPSAANEFNKKKSFALNLHSESESQGRGGVEEFDVSGPENDLAEDDFWN